MSISRFDLAVIKDISNVKYLSGPSNRPAKPTGTWLVTFVFTDDTILISKDETLVRLPISDVEVIGRYDLQKAKEQIEAAGVKGEKNGQEIQGTQGK
jgi:hypothetical protein